ncbi:PLDc N-terminal domain-containing protein [Methanohalophilus sp.]
MVLEEIWGIVTLLATIWVIYDVLTNNRRLSTMMKIIWVVAALLFGVLGAIAYYFIGKKR